MLQIQQIASDIVQQIFTQGRSLTALLAAKFARYDSLTQQQRGAIQDISYGAVRFYGLIDTILGMILHKPVKDKTLYSLLITSLYQLIFTSAKEHVIVYSAVELVSRQQQSYAKNLVNAALRAFLRRKAEFIANAQKTLLGQYSHPQWWIERLQQIYPNHWQTILQLNNTHPPMSLRINRRKTTSKHYIQLLQQQDIAAHQVDHYAIQLNSAIPVTALPYFFEGYISVQDRGAQFAAELLDVQDGMRVLDACAAPGGKSGHLLEIAEVNLTALDHDAARLALLQQNLKRLNFEATVHCADASDLASWWDGEKFDRIIADVPCSGSGVVRRHPDIKWLRRATDILKLATQQRKLLDQLWGCLRQHGKLLYTTCSIFPEENCNQIQDFMQRHPDAKRIPLFHNSMGQLLPTIEHDGFYYALIEKV